MKKDKTLCGGLACGILLAFLIGTGTGCAASAGTPQPSSVTAAQKTLKVGFYVDAGSQGAGVIHLARLIAYSPQLEMIPLTGEELRAGKLKGLDLFLLPGGSSAKQYESMQEAGAEAVRQYVADGGAFFGVCAGFHGALNRPERIGLLPYTFDQDNVGTRAAVTAEISGKGARLLDVPPGHYGVVYASGPIARPCAQPGTGWGEELAVYRNSISRPDRPEANFSGRAAILHGRYGKGKVIATSFHPEYRVSTQCIWQGCIYAVTGVKPVPLFPVKEFRPLRVGYYVTVFDGKRSIAEALMLDRQPDLDMNFSVSLPDGALDHLDVVVFPEVQSKSGLKALKNPLVQSFLKRGGKLIAVGPSSAEAPDHPNVIRLADGGELLAAIRRAGKP